MKNYFLLSLFLAMNIMYGQVPSNIVNLNNETSCTMLFELKIVDNQSCNAVTNQQAFFAVQPNSIRVVDIGIGKSATGAIVQEFGFGSSNCFIGEIECGNSASNIPGIAIGGQHCLDPIPAGVTDQNMGARLQHRYVGNSNSSNMNSGDNFWIYSF